VTGTKKMLVAREAHEDGHFQCSFEVIDKGCMDTEKKAGNPRWLALFSKWQDSMRKKGPLV
jgi:hypothetical protein